MRLNDADEKLVEDGRLLETNGRAFININDVLENWLNPHYPPQFTTAQKAHLSKLFKRVVG